MDGSELTQFSEMVGLIYEGATDSSRWTNVILPMLADYIQAPMAVLFNPLKMPKDGGFGFIHGMPQQQMEVYTTRYHQIDVHAQMAFAKGLVFEGNVILDSDIIPREELIETQYYKEYLFPWDTAYSINAIVFGMDSISGIPPTVCAIWRRSNAFPYEEQDREKMKLLVPHLSRSLGVLQRIQSAELKAAASFAVLDRLPTGVVLIDAQGVAIFANESAQRMFESGQGLRLVKKNDETGLGKLKAKGDLTDQAIFNAINTTLNPDPYVVEHFSRYVTVPYSSGAGCYILQFSALGNENEFNSGANSAAAIIFIADSQQKVQVNPDLLKNTYGLTEAESRVAIVLFECGTIQEVSDRMNISGATVRTHVKRIYSKLGVETRANFVKMMLGLAESHVSK